MLSQHLIDSLFPPDLPEPEHWERRYPPRDLPEGAEVTRFSPSPTGFLHIGGVYVATIDVDVARHSGGRYLVRLEDTDQARVTEGAAEQFAEAFAYFSIGPDEDDQTGHYGPYAQSGRAGTYLTYVRELLRQGKAYPCFATKQDLEEITARQRAAGALPGYYGKWAIWRDAPEEQVAERLAAGDPYVVRFRSPGVAGARVSFTDSIRGELTLDDNRNDAVILKSSDYRAEAADLPFRARRRRPPDAGHPGHPRRGVDLLGALAPAAVRRARLPSRPVRARRPADEAGRRKPPQAVQAEGPGGQRHLLHRAGFPGPGRAVLPARPGQRAAGRDAAEPGADRADQAFRDGYRGPAGRHGQARRHLRRLHRHPARRADSR